MFNISERSAANLSLVWNVVVTAFCNSLQSWCTQLSLLVGLVLFCCCLFV